MAIARHFTSISGSGVHANTTGDWLGSPVTAESYTGMTFAAWVKQDYSYPNLRAGLAGRLFDFHNGWAFFVSPENELTFFATGDPVDDPSQFQSVPCPDLSNWTFIAVTYLASGGSDNVKFYAGTTTNNLAVIGTGTRTGGFGELGVLGMMFGNVTQGDLLTGGAVTNWNGSMSRIGLWFDDLSLEELQEQMLCGTYVSQSSLKFFVDVNGTDPEDSFGVSLVDGGDWAVTGTYVESAYGIACEYVPYHSPPYLRFILGQVSDIEPEPPPPGGGGEEGTVAVNWPIRHFTMPEFTPGTTPLLGLKDPYILASDNTENSRIYAISHEYKADAGVAIRCELETGNITHGTMNQKRCEYYRFYVKRVDGGFFTLYINDENQGFDSGEVVSMDPLDTSEYVVAEVRSMGTYRSRRLKIVHTSATDDFELVRVEEGFTVLGR